MSSQFGAALKDWRSRRRMSQLNLGLSANVSARHISFLETGRSHPSRAMVLQPCDELVVPRLSRNHLLTAAGLAPAYRNRGLSDGDMAPVRDAVDWTLARQDPYPAIALDWHWTVLKMNRVATLLPAGLGLKQGESVLLALLENEAIRASIENFDEVLSHAIVRLRTECTHLGGDEILEDILERLVALRGDAAANSDGILPAFIPTRYRAGDKTFSFFFSTFTKFGTAEDIALSELKIEMMFPADEQTREQLHRL